MQIGSITLLLQARCPRVVLRLRRGSIEFKEPNLYGYEESTVPTPGTSYLEIAECGLYDASQARDWLPRPIQAELSMCQRYCYVIANQGTTFVIAFTTNPPARIFNFRFLCA